MNSSSDLQAFEAPLALHCLDLAELAAAFHLQLLHPLGVTASYTDRYRDTHSRRAEVYRGLVMHLTLC